MARIKNGVLRMRARVMRTDATEAERLLWNSIRNRSISGAKFRRQHPIGPFIVDFVCLDVNLIVELDGLYHDSVVERDLSRQQYLESLGFRVLRFSNDDIRFELETVVQGIANCLQSLRNDSPSAPSPGTLGEGRGEGSFQ